MRFARHLLAASALVAVVIGLAVAAGHTSLASLVSNDHDRRPPGAEGAPPDGGRFGGAGADGERFDGERRRPRGDHGIGISTADDLVQTTVTLGLLTGVVVVVDRRRPRRNRIPDSLPPAGVP